MKQVLVDSGGWLSVMIRTDMYHHAGAASYKAMLDQRAHPVTSDYVMDEVITRLYQSGFQMA